MKSDEVAAAPGAGSTGAANHALDLAKPSPRAALVPLPPLDTLVAAHIEYVRSVVTRFRATPKHCREDLVQDVMIAAHRSRRSRLDVRALLFGITRHMVFRWMARQAMEAAGVALVPGREAVTESGVEERGEEAERRELVWAAVDKLPAIFREVFIRIEIEQMSMPAVAGDLGIPPKTGYTRLRLARARFRDAVRRARVRRYTGGSHRGRTENHGHRR